MFVFIMGGACYSELRTAYEVTAANKNWEVIIGKSSLSLSLSLFFFFFFFATRFLSTSLGFHYQDRLMMFTCVFGRFDPHLVTGRLPQRFESAERGKLIDINERDIM